MKSKNKYYKIKWGSFFITVIILSAGILGAMLLRGNQMNPQEPAPQAEQQPSAQNGHYTNADFSRLIAENLSELDIIENLSFEGKSEGRFSISGTLSNPSRLAAICPELQPVGSVLESLKGKKITINGHLGEDESGNGQFVSDTIGFSGLTIPAGVATEYIEQYTSLNKLLEVPIQKIEINETGVSFTNEIPAAIQIASCNP